MHLTSMCGSVLVCPLPNTNEIQCLQMYSIKSVKIWGGCRHPIRAANMFLEIPPTHLLIPNELFCVMLLILIKKYQHLESFTHHPSHKQLDFQ